MKKTLITVAVFTVLAVAVFVLVSGRGGSAVNKNAPVSAAPAVEKKHTVTFTDELTIAEGKSVKLAVSGGAMVKQTYTSSDDSIVKVSDKGKITGKDCGVAYVSAELKDGGFDVIYNVQVTVIKNSFLREAEQSDANAASAQPEMRYAKLVKTGVSSTLYVNGLGRKDTLTFKSSDETVLSVDDDGLIRTLKEGDATVTASVTQDENTYTLTVDYTVADEVYDYSVTDEQRIAYYKDAAFIGNSIGVGLKGYIENNLKSKLGSPLIMVRGSYAFHNDKSSNHGYMIEYGGTEMKAKNAVKASGKKKIFINMGTNDLFVGAEKATQNYIEYVEGIKELNPDVEIFIESTTSATPGKAVKSSNVKILNDNMRKYCEEHEDFYFIDFNRKLVDGNYNLYPKYSSDNYVHLNNTAYAIWMDEVMAYTDKMMVGEQLAEEAVETAEELKLETHIKEAQALVDELPTGAVKDGLNKRLKALSSDSQE